MIIDDNDDAACLSRQVECVLLSQVVDVHLAEAAWLSIIFIFDCPLSLSLIVHYLYCKNLLSQVVCVHLAEETWQLAGGQQYLSLS